MRGAGRRRAKLILVLGGAASGKSQAALDLAGRGHPRAFVATAQALDREMAEKINRHRTTRPSDWETAEIAVDLAGWFTTQGPAYRTIVVDCLTLWLSNLKGAGVRDSTIPETVTHLLEAMRDTQARVVLVGNELGLGLVPLGRTVRRFRDMVGKVNQHIAAVADEVYFIVSGQVLRMK